MKVLSIAALAMMATTYVFAQEDISNDDIPEQCRSVCSNLVAVSDECDRLFDDDRDELNCMCQAENAQTVIPLCAACVTSTRNGTSEEDGNEDGDNDDNDDNDNNDDANDNDVNDLRSSCSFSSTTYVSTSSYAQVSLVAAASGASSRTGSTSGGAFSTTSLPATGTNPAATLSSAASSLVASVTDNAGAMVTPAPRIEGVGALAGAAFLAVAALA